MKSEKPILLVNNRKAAFEYFFLSTFEAGIVLTGTEIKSVRQREANLQDAFCYLKNGELWIKNMHISPYKEGTYNNVDTKRERKLLLNKNELRKIEGKLKEKGTTVVATKLLLNENGYAKIEIALAKGKKSFDKRQSLKEKDDKRQMAKMLKRTS
jgi:SsrA-binding protein